MPRALIIDTAADQLRVAYDGTNYVDFDVSLAGDLTVRPSGGDIALAAAVDVTSLSVGATAVISATRVLQNVTASAAILTSGTLPDARIAATGVTQHQGALSIGWAQLTNTPTTLTGYGITGAQLLPGALTLAGPAVTVDGGVSNSEALTLRGFYDADATVAVASTKRDFTARNIVTSGTAYRFALLNDAGTEVFSVSEAGVLAGVSVGWGLLTGQPTTLAGYGITDAAAANHTHAMDDLSDVVVTTPAEGHVLTWDATNLRWRNQAPAAGGASALGDLTDVTITTPAAAQVLRHNGTEWVNAALAFGDLASTPTTLAGYGITDAASATHTHAMDDLSDVVVTTPAEGHVLTWDATNLRWRNAAQSGGGAAALNDLSDVTLTTPASGQFLKFDGTAWVNAAGGTVDTAAAYAWTGQHTWSENLGLGIAATAVKSWGTGVRAIQWNKGAIMGPNAASVDLWILSNAYHNGTNWLHMNDGVAAAAQLAGGYGFDLRFAASALADAVVSWVTVFKVDTVGNIGLGGASLSPWSGMRAVEGALSSLALGVSDNSIHATSNGYWDGAWKYKAAGAAANIGLWDGGINFRVAASGTADAALTWTTALKINNAGNWGHSVVPDAWISSTSAINIGVHGAIMAQRSGTTQSWGTDFVNNAYHDSANWKYRNSFAAMSMYLFGSEAVFRTAPAGTAGGVVTWTERVKIDTTGLRVVNGALYFPDGTSMSSANSGTFDPGTGYIWTATQQFRTYQEFQNGANWDGSGAGQEYQIAFGYADASSTRHYLRTRHDATAGGQHNAVDFFLSDGTAAGAFGTAYHGLTVTAKGLKLGGAIMKNWSGNMTTIEFAQSAIMAQKTNPELYQISNAYFDSGWKYTTSYGAAMHLIHNVGHVFYVAPAGTADTAITWQKALEIDLNSNFGWGVAPGTHHPNLRAMRSEAGALVLPKTNGDSTLLTHNATHNGTNWVTLTAGGDGASLIHQNVGTIEFWVADTADTTVAGDTIAWINALFINKVGNLGVGVTPKAWHGNHKVIQGSLGALALPNNLSYGDVALFGNAYYDAAGEKYLTTAAASKYVQSAGKHYLQVAPSGSIDTAITWKTALLLDEAGNIAFRGGTARSFGATRTSLNFAYSNIWASDANSEISFSSNEYGPNTYIKAEGASRLYMYNGAVYIQTAPSGTAGTAITWETLLSMGAGTTVLRSRPGTSDVVELDGYMVTFRTGGTLRGRWDHAQFRPEVDNNQNLGHSSYRWGAVYAVNGTIQTSVAEAKTDFEPLNYEWALRDLMVTDLFRYHYKDDKGFEGKDGKRHSHRHVGVDLNKIPRLYRTTDEGITGNNLAAWALGAVKALKIEVDDEVTQLRNRVAELERQVAALSN